MPELNRLFEHYKTDKGQNGYAELYECLFNDKRQSVNKLIEIGIGTLIPGMWSTMYGYSKEGYQQGASLRAWRDYFPNSTVYGIDLQPDTQFAESRIVTMLADSRSAVEINKVMHTHGISQVDVVIDDGSHSASDQLATLDVMFRYVRPGGYYIIEDIGSVDINEFVKDVKNAVGDLPVFVLGPANNLCVITNSISGVYKKRAP
jgi:hypothetical protein